MPSRSSRSQNPKPKTSRKALGVSAPIPANLFAERAPHEIPDDFSDAELARTEKALGVKLPAAYVAALKVRNGGSLRRRSFKIETKAGARPPRKLYKLGDLAGVHATHWRSLTQLTSLARSEWELPAGLVAIAGDGHWWTCLDYRDCGPKGEPAVVHFENEPLKEYRVADSVAELLAGLHRATEDFEPAIIALDGPGPWDAKLKKALPKLGCKWYRYPGSGPRDSNPPAWRWEKYRPLWAGFEEVPISLEANLKYGGKARWPGRPAGHPVLVVAVHPRDEAACLKELLAVLGPKAEVLQGAG